MITDMEHAINMGFQSLIASIIELAVYDYECALLGSIDDAACEFEKSKALAQVSSLERFFLSDYCHHMTNIDGDVIITTIRKRVSEPGYVPKKWLNI